MNVLARSFHIGVCFYTIKKNDFIDKNIFSVAALKLTNIAQNFGQSYCRNAFNFDLNGNYQLPVRVLVFPEPRVLQIGLFLLLYRRYSPLGLDLSGELFFSVRFSKPFRHLVRLLGRGSARRKASAYTGQHNTERGGQATMPRAGFEPTIPEIERCKTCTCLRPRFQVFSTFNVCEEIPGIFFMNPGIVSLILLNLFHR
jgi:hypothetical protein